MNECKLVLHFIFVDVAFDSVVNIYSLELSFELE